MDTLAPIHLRPDLAARGRAALLAEAWNKAEDAEANADVKISDEEYGRLEEATKAAEKAYRDHGLDLHTNRHGNVVRCPNCNCPILEEDLESE